MNDEDAEKGLVYWDVLKACRLDSLKARALVEGARGRVWEGWGHGGLLLALWCAG